jgi:uncharacterized membrane protein
LAGNKKVDLQKQSRAPDSAQIKSVETREATIHSGPLPTPAMLAEYDRVHPGLAERIIALAEGEAAHRRSIQNSTLQGNIDYMRSGMAAEKRGQWLASSIAVVLASLGAYVVIQGHDVAGSAIGVTGVASIVTALIVGRTKNDESSKKGDK